ncbi:MAG: hypothetical protein OK439_06120 [Thaumarchaeota archaeon]|nr:hypothetical protein [Nitrososphaerota archaeon]
MKNKLTKLSLVMLAVVVVFGAVVLVVNPFASRTSAASLFPVANLGHVTSPSSTGSSGSNSTSPGLSQTPSSNPVVVHHHHDDGAGRTNSTGFGSSDD